MHKARLQGPPAALVTRYKTYKRYVVECGALTRDVQDVQADMGPGVSANQLGPHPVSPTVISLHVNQLHVMY